MDGEKLIWKNTTLLEPSMGVRQLPESYERGGMRTITIYPLSHIQNLAKEAKLLEQ